MAADLKQLDVPDARFSCAGCGRCCSTSWAVTLDATKAEQLRKHAWNLPGGVDPFVEHKGPGGDFRLRMVDGHCVFLDADKRCRIHAELGYEHKPESCKAFPLQFGVSQGVSYARLSFYCPTVCKGEGKKLTEQMKWVRAAARATNAEERTEATTLDGARALGARDFAALHGALVSAASGGAPLHERLAAVAGTVRVLVADAAGGDPAPAIGPLIERAAALPLHERVARGLADGSASSGWSMVSLYLSTDARPTTAARLLQLARLRLSSIGLAQHHSAFLRASASASKRSRVRFTTDEASLARVDRYLQHKLAARAYLTGHPSVVQGVNSLFTALAVLATMARLSAAGAGRDATGEADVAAGLEAADLLVLEHATLGQTPSMGAALARLLADETLSASMLAFARFAEPASDQR
ncbi:MAG: YkgJ family cysteine cluster protein [Deltaproteobacteria bacterium]|nr:YkgJ family cysteine cluster protein [Deltaproteobacteria bacterium]